MTAFGKLLKGKGEAARIVRRAGKTGSLPILSPAGTLRLNELFWQAFVPTFLFMWVFVCLIVKWRFHNNLLMECLAVIGAVVGMLWPTVAVGVYALGVYQTIRYSVARSSAVLFWMYWPCCRWMWCIVAVVAAWCTGNYIWFNNFRLHIEYQRLQAYDNVDAYTVTGNRMQDAGLAVFNTSNGVDRSKGACVVSGHTYCIAPIIKGGEVNENQQNRVGINDIFMAGIDCCTCPMTDFRCGDWRDTGGVLGGMRELNSEHDKFFRLAVDKWDANFNKVSVHSLFFNWVNDPVVAWKQLWTRGMELTALACIFGLGAPFLIMVLVNGLMRALRDMQIAAPLDDFAPDMPPIGLYGAEHARAPDRKSFVPDEYRDYLAQYEVRGGVPGCDPDPNFVII